MAIKISFQKPAKQPVLCVGIFDDNTLPDVTKSLDKSLKGLITTSLKNSKFKGKINQSLKIYTTDGSQVILIGLGKEKDLTDVVWQKIGSSILAALSTIPNGEGAVEIHSLKKTSNEEIAANIAYGALLKSWRFEKYFTKKKPEELFSVKKLTVLTPDPTSAEKLFKPLSKCAEGVEIAKTISTEPANVMTPDAIAKIAETLSKDGVKVEIFNEKELKKMGMNALLGVSQGSDKGARLVVLRWNGGDKNEAPVAIVGKGVTFDSGGISIKPATNMEDMKYDMSGAAVVIGLLKTLALRKAKANVIGLAGIVENMPSGTAQRPGDVVKSLSGQTIEVINTDAEGRLVLADVLWYTQHRFKPKLMVDLATLTGAIVISLGATRAGLFSSDKTLAKKLFDAGEKVGELLWEFPMDDDYDSDINSEIADVKNTGSARGAGSVTAAKFLQRFTNKVPWAHLDIAGTAYTKKELTLSAPGSTAFGVRLLNRFIQDNYE
jgi:leucyl aminopeptidase